MTRSNLWQIALLLVLATRGLASTDRQGEELTGASHDGERIYCFHRATIESVTTFHAHDEQEKSYDYLYYGVLTEGTKTGSPVVYVKAKPLSPVGRVLELALAGKRSFGPCFNKETHDILRKEFAPKNKNPRYEHQIAVELVGAAM